LVAEPRKLNSSRLINFPGWFFSGTHTHTFDQSSVAMALLVVCSGLARWVWPGSGTHSSAASSGLALRRRVGIVMMLQLLRRRRQRWMVAPSPGAVAAAAASSCQRRRCPSRRAASVADAAAAAGGTDGEASARRLRRSRHRPSATGLPLSPDRRCSRTGTICTRQVSINSRLPRTGC
jgi:hypothetical protein